MRLKIFIITVLLSGLNLISEAQPRSIQFDHLSVDDGLPHTTVTCIIQDHLGFMWFGTLNGLCRYDGYNIKIFLNDPEDSTSISNNQVWTIFEDSYNRLWVGTRGGGINLYNPEKDVFTCYKHDPNDKNSLPFDIIRTITQDHSGRIWIGTYKGVCWYDTEKDRFNRLSDELGISDDEQGSIYSFSEDIKGQLWIGSLGNGLLMLNKSRSKVTKFTSQVDDPKSLIENAVMAIFTDSQSRLWVGTKHGVSRLNINEPELGFVNYTHSDSSDSSISGGSIYAIDEDKAGRIWFGTDEGLDVFNNKEKSFSHYRHSSLTNSSLSDNQVWSICEDKTGLLWFGTHWGGINIYKPSKNTFTQYSHNALNPLGLSNKVVQSIIQDRDGDIWLGIDHGGVNFFDKEMGTFVHYCYEEGNEKSLSSNPVLDLEEDSYGYIWVGTWGGGLNRFDKRTGDFKRYPTNCSDSLGICGENVFAIFEDRDRTLWIGTHDCGLHRYNRETDSFTIYKLVQSDSASISSNRIFCIQEDNFNNLWVGTNSGLNLFEKKTKQFKVFSHDSDVPLSLIDNTVRDIFQDSKNRLWIATNAGLSQFNYDEGNFNNYTTRNGLPSNVVSSILEDDNGNLWLGTYSGLSRFNPDMEIFQNIKKKDGILANQLRYRSACKLNSGEFAYGTPVGFFIFHPDSIVENHFVPEIVFTGFNLFSKPVRAGYVYRNHTILTQSINETELIELPHYLNDIAFEIAALDYTAPEGNSYAYMFDEEDEDWISLGNEGKISFNNLKAGEYILKVKGSNSDGIWNEEGRQITFIINPPFWKTWYALVFYILFGSLFLSFLLRSIVKKERLTKELEMSGLVAEQERQLNELKFRFFTNVSHEFRTPLTLIIAPVCELISKSRELQLPDECARKLDLVSNNAQRLLRLVNQLIEFRKTESGLMDLKVSECNISELVFEISQSFGELANINNIEFQAIDHIKENTIWCESTKIEMAINNLLSNALRYAPANGFVRLRIEEDKDWIFISVEDNGPGISPEEQSKIFDRYYQTNNTGTGTSGIGLSLSKRLVELHKGEIWLQSTPNESTIFKIKLPKGRSHFSSNQFRSGAELTSESDFISNPLKQQQSKIRKVPAGSGQKSILVIDDNPDIRDYLNELLSVEYNVSVASDGMEGWEKAICDIPDLIISDILMPNKDGYELCKNLKNDERTQHIPVFLLTAKGADQFRYLGVKQGADDYISKPFDPNYLLERVNQALITQTKLVKKYSKKIVLGPDEVEITPLEEIWVEKAKKIIEKNLSKFEFDTHKLASELGMSHSSMYRKLSPVIKCTPAEFIRNVRLERGAQLLSDQQLTIQEISLQVGFLDLKTFRNWFEKKYELTPSKYRKQVLEDNSSLED